MIAIVRLDKEPGNKNPCNKFVAFQAGAAADGGDGGKKKKKKKKAAK